MERERSHRSKIPAKFFCEKQQLDRRETFKLISYWRKGNYTSCSLSILRCSRQVTSWHLDTGWSISICLASNQLLHLLPLACKARSFWKSRGLCWGGLEGIRVPWEYYSELGAPRKEEIKSSCNTQIRRRTGFTSSPAHTTTWFLGSNLFSGQNGCFFNHYSTFPRKLQWLAIALPNSPNLHFLFFNWKTCLSGLFS